MRIPVKIFLVVAILWMTAVALAAYALSAFSSAQTMAAASNAAQDRALAAESTRSAVVTTSFWLDQLSHGADFQARARAKSAIFNAVREIERNAPKMSAGLSESERLAYRTFDRMARNYVQQAERLVRDMDSEHGAAGHTSAVDAITPDTTNAVLANLDYFSWLARQGAREHARASVEDQIASRQALIDILVLGFGASLVAALWISFGGIVRPIQLVTEALNRLSTGEVGVSLHQPTGRTEVDDLWRTAGAFQDTLIRLRRESDAIEESRSHLEAALRRDVLTGLGNRDQFHHDFPDFAASAHARPQGRFGLLLLDLDRFKLVNDTLGHCVGDRFLAETARRIARAAGSGGVAYRLGGDEFAVLVECLDEKDVLERAASIATAVGQPLSFGGPELKPVVSIGCAIFPDHATDVDTLVLFADKCLYAAKRETNKIRLFAHEMKAEIEFAQGILSDLRPAIERGQFVVHYQPKVSAGRHAHVGFEALLRWQHPRHGLVPPGRFLPIAERASLMLEITSCVLDMVSRDIAEWHAAGLPFGKVAVNIPEVIVGADFGAAFLEQFVERHAIAWTDLTFEVTEDVFVHRNAEHILMNLKTVSDRGAQVSLDDFGTGFASLTHLRRIPLDEVKIDRSFTADIGRDMRAEQIIRMLLDLSRRLGKATVAEGVETTEQAAFLLAEGCQVLQGYLIARPMPKTEATAWLLRAAAEERGTGTVTRLVPGHRAKKRRQERGASNPSQG